MATNDKVKCIPLSMFDSANLSNEYAAVNASGLPAACYKLRLINTSNKGLFISFDKFTDNEFVPTNETLIVTAPASKKYLSKGTIVYIKGSPNGSGEIYLAGYYI